MAVKKRSEKKVASNSESASSAKGKALPKEPVKSTTDPDNADAKENSQALKTGTTDTSSKEASAEFQNKDGESKLAEGVAETAPPADPTKIKQTPELNESASEGKEKIDVRNEREKDPAELVEADDEDADEDVTAHNRALDVEGDGVTGVHNNPRFVRSVDLVSNPREVHDAVYKILANRMPSDRKITDASNLFDDLGFTYEETVAIAADIEEALGVTISVSEAQNFTLVRDVVNTTYRKVEKARA